MTQLRLKNVGDGLLLNFYCDTLKELNVDCGGNINLDKFYSFYGDFLLSHFHADHYNGISKYGHKYVWCLENFYYPAMPKFKDSIKFQNSLLAMNYRICLNESIQGSILSIIKSLNRQKVNFSTLSKGDFFITGGRKYEVLWPPKELENGDAIVATVRRAIDDFEKARKVDRVLDDFYTQVQEKNDDSFFQYKEFAQSPPRIMEQKTLSQLPELVQKANKSLRDAANRLSIAFRQDDNVLFLGDLESDEIKKVVSALFENNNYNYDILISAHHGTHWHTELKKIKWNICLASVGMKLKRHIKEGYKKNDTRFFRTDELGDITIGKVLYLK